MAPTQREPAQDADGPDGGEHRQVVAVDLVLERRIARLIQAVEFQLDPSPVWEDEPVKADGEPLLVLTSNGLCGADGAGAARDEDTLTVGGIKRNRDLGEDRSCELAGELRHERRFEKRSLVDSFPAWGIQGIGHPGGPGGGHCRWNLRRSGLFIVWRSIVLGGDRRHGGLKIPERLVEHGLAGRRWIGHRDRIGRGLLLLFAPLSGGPFSASEDHRTNAKGPPPPLNVLQAQLFHQLELRIRLVAVLSLTRLPAARSSGSESSRSGSASRISGNARTPESGREILLVLELLAPLAIANFAFFFPPLLLGQAHEPVSKRVAGDGFLLSGGSSLRRRGAAAELIAECRGSAQDGDQADGDLGEESSRDRAGRFRDDLLPKRGRGFVRHLRAPNASG